MGLIMILMYVVFVIEVIVFVVMLRTIAVLYCDGDSCTCYNNSNLTACVQKLLISL